MKTGLQLPFRKFLLLALVCIAAPTFPVTEHGDKLGEMERYRQIEESPSVTCQDLVDLLLMVRGEYDKYHSPEKRIEHARHEGWIKKLQPGDKLDRGHLAFALMKNFEINRGWLFLLTKMNRFALRDVQQAGIMSVRYGTGNLVSGAELVGAVHAAENYQSEKSAWSQNH
ncbi:MAG: hypothetical protein U1F27_00525 [Turneriella sp.]